MNRLFSLIDTDDISYGSLFGAQSAIFLELLTDGFRTEDNIYGFSYLDLQNKTLGFISIQEPDFRETLNHVLIQHDWIFVLHHPFFKKMLQQNFKPDSLSLILSKTIGLQEIIKQNPKIFNLSHQKRTFLLAQSDYPRMPHLPELKNIISLIHLAYHENLSYAEEALQFYMVEQINNLFFLYHHLLFANPNIFTFEKGCSFFLSHTKINGDSLFFRGFTTLTGLPIHAVSAHHTFHYEGRHFEGSLGLYTQTQQNKINLVSLFEKNHQKIWFKILSEEKICASNLMQWIRLTFEKNGVLSL